MRLIDADALKEHFPNDVDWEAPVNTNEYVCECIDNAPTIEPFEKIGAICDENCGYRPQGKWVITGEEQGAFGITYKIRKCDKCGWEHSLVIPDNFCPICGADMRGGVK